MIDCAVRSACVVLLAPAFASAQTTVRASVTEIGTQLLEASEVSSVSADGRYVAFESAMSFAPYTRRVRRFDRLAGTAQIVTLGVGGAPANGACRQPSLSGDGRFLAFQSEATNLGPIDTNTYGDIYVRDLSNGATQIVTVGPTGLASTDWSDFVEISLDGRYVAFTSDAGNLVLTDGNNFRDAFVRDLQTGVTTMASVSSSGIQANFGISEIALSGDGNCVGFSSGSTNLASGDTNGKIDIFVRDRTSGVTERVDVGPGGVQANNDCYTPTLSADGRFVAFYSEATNLVVGDVNGQRDVFVRDRTNGVTLLASLATGGIQVNGPCQLPRISADGRWVTFTSFASNLVAGFPGTFGDIAVHDLATGVTTIESVSMSGGSNGAYTLKSTISGDGRFVAFLSQASNLVVDDTNGAMDTFLRDRGASAGFAFCRGDGVQAPCPCGNVSPTAANAGCLSSLGQGAALAASGGGSLSADTIVLSGSGMPDSTALYFQGTGASSGTAFGDGLRCATGSITRLATRTNASGASQFPSVGDPTLSLRGGVASPGTRTYQVWYRNAAAFCTSATFNLSNGWRIDWGA